MGPTESSSPADPMSLASTRRSPAHHRGLSVCLVTGEYPPASGGVADYTALLGRNLQFLGARVAVLTGPLGGADPECSTDALPVYRVGGWGPAALPVIRRAFAEIQADVI